MLTCSARLKKRKKIPDIDFWVRLLYTNPQITPTNKGFSMSKQEDPLLKKLDLLAEKLNVLTTVILLKEHTKKILEGKKTQKEQIQTLKKWKLPNEVIALIIDTTPDVIGVRASEMKVKKTRKEKQPKPEQKVTP
jgi:hypothetical protein